MLYEHFECYSTVFIVLKVFPWGNILYNTFKWVNQGSGLRIFLGVQRPQGRQLVWHIWGTARRAKSWWLWTLNYRVNACYLVLFLFPNVLLGSPFPVFLVSGVVAALHKVLCLLSNCFVWSARWYPVSSWVKMSRDSAVLNVDDRCWLLAKRNFLISKFSLCIGR